MSKQFNNKTLRIGVKWWMNNEKKTEAKYGPLGEWDVSQVTDMSWLFSDEKDFNADISGWDVSNVTNMFSMFNGAIAFNGDISGWDVSNVTNMGLMFAGARAFSGDLSGWDVSKVTTMSEMFLGAKAFNCDISGWDVSNVIDMSSMFSDAKSFNGNISGWDVSNVDDISKMFSGAEAFNGDLSKWTVNLATITDKIFENAISLEDKHKSYSIDSNAKFRNESLSHAVKHWAINQSEAEDKYGPISEWDVSKVTNMDHLFNGWCEERNCRFSENIRYLNPDISKWDVSNVTSMEYMFHFAFEFNRDISGWNVGKVESVHHMFYCANAFDCDISGWDVSNITDYSNFLGSIGIDSKDYAALYYEAKDYGVTGYTPALMNYDFSAWKSLNEELFQAVMDEKRKVESVIEYWENKGMDWRNPPSNPYPNMFEDEF